MDLTLFFTSIQKLLQEMKEVPKKPDVSEIRYPGERRKRESEGRLLTGIELSGNVEQELKELGEKFNIHFPEAMSLDHSRKSLSL